VPRATSRFGSRSRLSAALALAVGLALAAPARADDGWSPVLEQDGVTVVERAAPDRALPVLRGEVEIDADPYEIAAVIVDVPAQTEWMWQCRESRVLRRGPEGDELVYQLIHARWPATDRDVVFASGTHVLEPERRVAVRFHSIADSAAPPVAGLVRMARLDGEFEVTALAPGRSRVRYTLDADPGGVLPASFLRAVVKESPFDTLVGLRRRVGETRGRYAESIASLRAQPPR
jgi:hypothetical protein